MESRVESTKSHEERTTGSENWKMKNRNENKKKSTKGTAKKKKKKSTSDDQKSEDITEYDEAERLFLPYFDKESFVEATRNKIQRKYPEHFNVDEYQKLSTPAERRQYRNSKDLRNNLEQSAKSESVPEHSDLRICYTQLRGQKCLDPTCAFRHEFRLPRKLRLCNEWKKGFCAEGHSCLYLHSEFPCRFHYLGLNYVRHDPKTCRYHHGGPLPKEYEDMFLKSIDLKRYPKSIEMYENQIIRLKATASDSTQTEFEPETVCGTTDQRDIDKCSMAPVDVIETDVDIEVNDCQPKDQLIQLNAERKAGTVCSQVSAEQEVIDKLSGTPAEIVIQKSLKTVVGDEVNDKDECRQKDPESSDESESLVIDE